MAPVSQNAQPDLRLSSLLGVASTWRRDQSGVTRAGWAQGGFRSDLFQVGEKGIFVVLPLLVQLVLVRKLVTGQLHSDLKAVGV